MHELVIVISDVYLSPESAARPLPPGVALPGLQRITRFATRSPTEGGWRAWLARWLVGARPAASGCNGAIDVASAAVATIAALGRYSGDRGPSLTSEVKVPTGASTVANVPVARGPMVWLATPVHLVAGMSSVHLDSRGVLRLGADDQATLTEGFRSIFHDSGFVLEPLDSGDFLLFGPDICAGEGAEPARFLGESVPEVPKGSASDPALRRLSAEIEMWLYEHPVNAARTRRGEAPITGLWLWGAGAAPMEAAAKRGAASGSLGKTMVRGAGLAPPVAGAAISEPAVDIAFGRDAYVQGLWASVGQKLLPLPQQLADVFGYPHAQRAVLVIEIGAMLQSVPTWTLIDGLVQLDRAFLTPALETLQSGKLQRIVLLVNDRELTLGRRDHLKLWRRMPTSLSGLQ